MSASANDNHIEECRDIIQFGIPWEYPTFDKVIITTKPEAVVDFGAVSLWAQHLKTGSKEVDLRLPGITKFLKELASRGVGLGDEYDYVMYRFLWKNLDESSSESEMSDL